MPACTACIHREMSSTIIHRYMASASVHCPYMNNLSYVLCLHILHRCTTCLNFNVQQVNTEDSPNLLACIQVVNVSTETGHCHDYMNHFVVLMTCGTKVRKASCICIVVVVVCILYTYIYIYIYVCVCVFYV